MSRVMTWNRCVVLVTLAALAGDARSALAQDNRIDVVAPTAPDLAPYGASAPAFTRAAAAD